MEFRITKKGLYLQGAICIFFLLLSTTKQTSGECVFGADNIARLALRNATIVKLLNDTIFSYTSDATTAVKNISNFDVWVYLQKTYLLNAGNYLDFVIKGRLYGIDWDNATDIDRFNWDKGKNEFYNSATQIWWKNETGVTYFPGHIYDNLVTPMDQALQNITMTYSFSYGIYRPSGAQMYYTGLSVNNASAVLDPTCLAGSYFNLQLPTDLSATIDVFDTYGAQFATFATMIDSTFDNFFRNSSSVLNTDFVRVSVINAYTIDSVNVTVDMEVYFINDTFEPNFVLSYIISNLTKLQPMIFTNATGYSSKVSILSNNVTNVIVNSYINAVPTTEPPTTTEPTTLELTTIPTTESSTVPTTESSTTVPTTKSSTAIPTTTMKTTLSTTLPTTLPTVPTTTVIPTTSSTSIIPTTVTTPATTITTAASTNATSSSTLLPATTVLSATTALPTNASILILINNSTATNLSTKNVTSLQQTALPSNNSTLLATTAILSNNFSVLTPTAFLSNTSLNNANNASSTTPVVTKLSNTTITRSTGNISSVSYQNLTTKMPNGTTVSRQTTKGSNTGTGAKGGAKYVPQGPSLMMSLTQDSYFYTITIPAITGLILSIIGCMALWQVDCTAKPKI